MAFLTERHRWALVSSGSAMAAAALTRGALKQGWKRASGRQPPQNPASPHVSWKEATAWAVATGAAVSLARLVAERGAAAGWRKMQGRQPRVLRRKRA